VSPSPAQEAIGERQKAQARSRLNMASNYQVAGQNENAAALLAQAVRFDPALRDDPVAVNLAAVLTGRPADEALAALLAEVDARATERRKVREPVTRNPVAIRIAVIVVELPLLFLALHLFHTVLVIKLTNAPYDGLQALLVSFRPTTISRIAPLAFSSLVLVTLGVFVMYYVGATMLQGEATALRFLSIMLGVEVVSFFLGAVALLIVPLFASVPVSETEVAVIIHVGWAFVLGVGVLFWQAYFAARAQNYSLGAGLMTLFVGAAITIVLWEVLGIRRALRLN
jgi:hypothetical protein